MILAILVSILLHPLPQSYSPEYYQWCMTNIGQGAAYCCGQAGGVLTGVNSSWVCIDPDSRYTPPPPTLQPHNDIVMGG